MSAQDQLRKQNQSRPVIQPKFAPAARNPKQPVAPPPYRPQQANKSVQPKVVQMRRQPIAPPVYRPQPTPKVLQTKKAHDQRPATNLPQHKPVAPPVYRPQPTPKCLQAKMTVGQQAQASKSPRRPVAPPVYRPVSKKIVQPKFATIQRVLESPDEVDRYARSIYIAQKQWDNLTDEERITALTNEFGPMFEKIGVRPPAFKLFGNESDRSGEFDSTTWSIAISKKNLRNNPTAIAKTFYHESRHAEQNFLIARHIVQNDLPFPRANQIPDHVIDVAKKAPTLSSEEGREAKIYYESFYGSGSEARNYVLKRLAIYSTGHLDNLKKAWEDAKDEASKILETGKKLKDAGASDEVLNPIRKNHKDAKERVELRLQQFLMDCENFKKAQADYRALPEEADAHARGDQVEMRLKELEVRELEVLDILRSMPSVPTGSPLGSSSSAVSLPSLDVSPSLTTSPHAISSPIQIGLPSSVGPYDPTPPNTPPGGWADTPPSGGHLETH